MLRAKKAAVAVLTALAALLMSMGLAQARDRDEVTIRVPGSAWYVSPPPVVVNPPTVYYSPPPVYVEPPPTVFYGPSGYYYVVPSR